ncbi:Uncharacterised protein [uncultured archaeon]|nr:Uncharacterised protein [uncultured archaeon]
MSSSGQYQLAIVYGTTIYISSNYGQTWTVIGAPDYFISVAMSASGQIQLAVNTTGLIYVSLDFGLTWNSYMIHPSSSATFVCISPDGSTIYTSVDSVGIYRSFSTKIFRGRANITNGLIPRTNTVASSATPTINVDLTDIFTITALATDITSFTTNLTGTAYNGQRLTVRILDNGVARSITWGTSFASRGATLPITTVPSKYLYVNFIYNSTTSTWDCILVAQEA